MKIDYMREFVALAKTLNFSRTAEQMFITQSALSRHVAIVEESVGAQLFIRNSHNVQLTAAGEAIYEDFRRILNDYESSISKGKLYSTGYAGKLKLGVLGYCIEDYITPIILQLKTYRPHIKLSTTSYQPPELWNALLNDVIDIGLCLKFDYNNSEQIRFHSIGKERFVLMLSQDHPLAINKTIRTEQLAGQILVLLSGNYVSNYAKNLCDSQGIIFSEIVIADQIDTLDVTVRETHGVAIVPQTIRNMIRHSITYRNIEDDTFYAKMCLAYKTDSSNPIILPFLKQVDSVFHQGQTQQSVSI